MKRTNKQQRQTSPGRALESTYKTSATQWNESPRNNRRKRGGRRLRFACSDPSAAGAAQQREASPRLERAGWAPASPDFVARTEVPSLIRLSLDQQGRDVRRRLEPGGNTGTAHSSRTAGAAGATDRGSQRAACASEKARLPRSQQIAPAFTA